jgi:cytochrome c-type biogenesis protein CcsB
VVAFFAVALFLGFGVRFNIWFAGPVVLAVTDALLAYAQGWNKGLEPLVPSLKNNYWIYYHVPVVLASYAAFLIGFATSILYLLKRQDEERGLRLAGRSVGAAVASGAAARPRYLAWLDLVPASASLEIITYRVIAIGEILLTVGIILGSLWAHDAWGSYWQNDPKELAALTCWIWYAAYLHLHTRPSFRGNFLAWMAIIGFGVVLFCYFGVNIWISGLHSYK